METATIAINRIRIFTIFIELDLIGFSDAKLVPIGKEIKKSGNYICLIFHGNYLILNKMRDEAKLFLPHRANY